MCGIVGFWLAKDSWDSSELLAMGRRMSDSLRHRGPDGNGHWRDPSKPLVLGHRRLSIQDNSAAGQQPMTSRCGRYLLIYNGELYGFQTIAHQLQSQGIQLRGHSDTEVLLESISAYGLAATLRQINGMYAFALWDRQDQVLHLARDPLGIKPLYYGWQGGHFLFASELKAIRAFPGFVSRRNHLAVCEFFKVGYIPAPLSVEKDIFKLLPGHHLRITASDSPSQPEAFWSLINDGYLPGQDDRSLGELSVASDQLDEILTRVVEEHLISDVPLGAFLSGGIDSSLVVAMMRKVATGKVSTFSIGFDQPQYNEAGFAKDVAEHLRTDHHQQIITSQEAQQVVPLLPEMYDEPFADSSQIPTFLVSKFAKQSVTVALSGDGGDEFFGGYRRYPYFYNLWQKVNRLPEIVRRTLGGMAGRIATVLPRHYRDSLRWRSDMLSVQGFPECYERFNRHWKFPHDLLTPDFLHGVDGEVRDSIVPYNMMPADFSAKVSRSASPEFDWMMLHDSLRYLPDDILSKVDRASMACSLETRVPLLDKRIVEFSWRLNAGCKQGDNPSELVQNGKVVLREVLSRYLPRSLFERPKVGFGVPLEQWLRGPLRDWAEALLDEGKLRQQGVFQVEPLRRIWQAHLSEREDWQYLLWDVLIFQACEGTK